MSDQDTNTSGGVWLLVLFGMVLMIIGLPLLYGGVQLIGLGGSWYYALAGAGIIVSGFLFALRRRAGFWLYILIFVATVPWALWEAGLNFWPLVPRLVAPAVLAVIALLLAPLFPSSRSGKRGPFALAGVLVIGLIATAAYAFQPHGVIRNTVAATEAPTPAAAASSTDWRHYGRTPAGTRYAPIDQITRDNVKDLKVAWTFRTGDVPVKGAEDQNTPLQVGDTVYTCSSTNVINALNAETGEPRWKFDPKASAPLWQRCRGVSYYEPTADATAPAAGVNAAACAGRIVMTTIDARLIESDAKTGQPCPDFGQGGTVDLKQGMGEVKPGFYFQTSAPTVMRDLIMIGGWVWDNVETGEPSGAVRAFSAKTGELMWAWDLGNPDITKLPPEGQSYTRGTPNVWSTPSYDDALGLVYLPTGNATPDFFGAERSKAAEDYTASVVALDIATGRERWKFQTVHHDLWDYDLPSQPALYDVPDGKGGKVPALIQVTKRGQIFMLDRRDGKPIAEVQEKPVPQDGGAKEDFLSPTQPYSVGMPSIGDKPFTEASMWGATPLDQLYCRIGFKKLRYEGEFTPPGLTRSLQFPGYYGGMNWGSASIDEANGYLVVNDIRMPQFVVLLPRAEADNYGPSAAHDGLGTQLGTPYGALKNGFMSPLGVPCHQPPYGTISAIDLKSRQLVWQVPAGTLQDTGPFGMKTGLQIPVGMPSLGGPVTTAGGLVFYAGTQDYYLRAIDVATGEELWKGRLPVGAQATPITYTSPESGRQFVVVSAGGARQSPDRGDYIVAYALPRAP
ncbi:membrane-bound PQQ-dependent dehydrogenase, glucose/quinate/shikimate family [Mesorhizobium sp. M7A.F.Ca.US.010.02.1.1]|uniref:membrane-bound PQQ-dependent dehydrogenase, glucose/quinate/shikimate family n=1 Tax=Mesorhizobium sp. M7A.F.Ca.US.010.02.1.1 TaxID=2496743 RepID=UPI000FD478AA|nr:membrane-bound PQQ-dependent dehydrogenase, glucose/quinate/shikimate family [Mesorhizobium sp. M7A.F.Ca.US.010.02.1.1]RUW92105.1 membrane-bound PQQ-dependent dehydrogenase, glucose/quinate/shikimate family [Mesorhizobium sp. M7A.F.Ca.US.010.02.1.1]